MGTWRPRTPRARVALNRNCGHHAFKSFCFRPARTRGAARALARATAPPAGPPRRPPPPLRPREPPRLSCAPRPPPCSRRRRGSAVRDACSAIALSRASSLRLSSSAPSIWPAFHCSMAGIVSSRTRLSTAAVQTERALTTRSSRAAATALPRLRGDSVSRSMARLRHSASRCANERSPTTVTSSWLPAALCSAGGGGMRLTCAHVHESRCGKGAVRQRCARALSLSAASTAAAARPRPLARPPGALGYGLATAALAAACLGWGSLEGGRLGCAQVSRG